MKRICLTGDDEGRWFDADKARVFEEDTRWDGSNQISRATGSQWEHQALYQTASGCWVLNSWSQCQGTGETYELIGAERAAMWLLRNLHNLPDSLEEFAARLEI